MKQSTSGARARRASAVGAALGALLALPAAGAAQQDGPAERVTLEQAVARALASQPQVVQAAGAVRTSEAAERSALGAYLPSLSASAGSSLGGSTQIGSQAAPVQTGVNESYNAGLSASWALYTGGRRGAERARARAQGASADAGLVEQRYGAVLATEQAFYEVLRAQELTGVAESRIESAQEGVAAAQRRMDVGNATRSDVLRAQLELNTARQSLLQARNAHDAATFQLGRLVGAEGAVGAAPTEPVEPAPLALSAADLAERLLADAPALRAAEASLRAASAGVTAARAQYLPSLNLSTGYDWSTRELGFATGNTGWRVGLGVSLPLFDGFQRSESTERARVQEEVAEAQLADARRALRADVERLTGNLSLAGQRIELNTEAVRVAEEDLRVQQDRYRLGASTILDLLASQTALVQARTDLVGARYDYQLARAELEALAGRAL